MSETGIPLTPMQPFCEGYVAGIRGVGDPRCCPYDKMTKEWNEWNRGQGLGCGVVLMRGLQK